MGEHFKTKVSILVPIFNAEKFLSECLDSLVGQTLKNIEIICINDGSTDKSPEIIKEYAKKDERIIMINKKNTGYGDSMNKGLKVATGEYIGIVEPDDFAELNMFEKMYLLAKRNRAEVVKANFYEYYTEKKKDVGKSDLFLANEVNRVISPKEYCHIFFQQPSIWSAIYNAKFLRDNNIDFLPSAGASYQDAGFTFKVWAMAKRVIFVDEDFLHYRKDNPNSSVKSAGKIYAVKDEYDAVEKYLEEKGLMDTFGPTLAVVRLSGYIWNMRRLERSAAAKFAKIVRNDYDRYKKLGYLDESNFEDKDALFVINSIVVRKPMKYLNLRLLYEAWDDFKQLGFRLRKQLKVI